MFSGKLRVLAGRLKSTHVSFTPVVTSPNVRRKVFVCCGTLLHARGGVIGGAPLVVAQVYAEGRAWPLRNAGLVSTMDTGTAVTVGVGVAWCTGVPRWKWVNSDAARSVSTSTAATAPRALSRRCRGN
jgi:hypothetical protein